MSDLIQCVEEWREIPSLGPHYSASSLGRIRRNDGLVRSAHNSTRRQNGRILKSRPLPLGHLQVTLSVGGVRLDRLVHRLVAECFLPAPLPGQDCVLHRDDDPSNNRPGNLFWGTRTDNSADKVAKGRQAKGERVGAAKISEGDVREIRHLAASGVRQRDIAKRFGVSQSNVSMIANGITWGHSL